MRRFLPAFLTILIALFLWPGQAEAAPVFLSALEVRDAAGNPVFSGFNAGIYEYDVKVDFPCRLTLEASAGPEVLIICDHNREQGLGELCLEFYIKEETWVAVLANSDSGSSAYNLYFCAKEKAGQPSQPEPEPEPEPEPPRPDPQPTQPEPVQPPPQPNQPVLPAGPGQAVDLSLLVAELSALDRPPVALPTAPAAPVTTAEFHIRLSIGNTLAQVNGKAQQLEAAPYIDSGYTMVPLRFVAEALGGQVYWDAASRTALIIFEGRFFELTAGRPVPGYPVSAQVVAGRTFVPLRYVMENFGAKVSWDAASKSIEIIYPGF